MSKNSIKPLELVVSAIHCLRESRGSSPQDILRYLEKKYNVGREVLKPHIQTGLRRGISFGLITQESGLYRLNDMLSDPVNEKTRKQSGVKLKKSSTKNQKSARKRTQKKVSPKRRRRVVFKTSLASQKNKKKSKGLAKNKRRKGNCKHRVHTRRKQNEPRQRRKTRRQKTKKLKEADNQRDTHKLKTDETENYKKGQEYAQPKSENSSEKS